MPLAGIRTKRSVVRAAGRAGHRIHRHLDPDRRRDDPGANDPRCFREGERIDARLHTRVSEGGATADLVRPIAGAPLSNASRVARGRGRDARNDQSSSLRSVACGLNALDLSCTGVEVTWIPPHSRWHSRSSRRSRPTRRGRYRASHGRLGSVDLCARLEASGRRGRGLGGGVRRPECFTDMRRSTREN